MGWGNWSQELKTGVFITIVILSILALFFFFASIGKYISNEEYQRCQLSLNQTNLQLQDYRNQIKDLDSEKKMLMDESSDRNSKLEECEAKLLYLNQKYTELQKKYDELNKTYQDLLKKYDELNKKYQELQNTGHTEKEVYFRNSLIAVLILLCISFPISITVEDDTTKKIFSWFAGTFSVSMLVFGYINILDFWPKFWISFGLAFLASIIAYVKS